MTDINTAIHNELKQYAQMLFEAIIEANTTDGECRLKPGKYSAKELSDTNKAACGPYAMPDDELINESVKISSGGFNCEFPFWRAFDILAKWEAISKPGKNKAVFEIGSVEEKSVKVILSERNESGAYIEKRMKLQRITGNWWMPRKVKKSESQISLYYELNGVMFAPGKCVWSTDIHKDSTRQWCEKYDDAKIINLMNDFLSNHADDRNPNTPYYAEINKRANIAVRATETPQISTETAERVNVSAEYVKEAEIEPICELYDNNESMPELDAMLYYDWMNRADKGKYRTVAESALAEVWTNIFLAAYRSGTGHLLTINNNGELIETEFTVIADLQAPQISPTANYATATCRRRQTARKRQNRAIKRHRPARKLTKRKHLHYIRGFTNTMRTISGYNTPPIRGDCMIRVKHRAKRHYFTRTDKISIFKPP